MLAQYLDLTEQFLSQENNIVTFEVSNYDYVLAQFVGLSLGIDFYSTIDGGAVEGVTDGSVLTADNFQYINGTNLSDNTQSQFIIGESGIYRFDVVGRYIRFQVRTDVGPSVDKLLIMLAKIG